MDAIRQQFAGRIRSAAAAGTALRLRGGGTKDFYGGPLQGDVLDTKGYAGIIEHDPGELIVRARCGTPLTVVESLLSVHGQCLPFDPPQFGAAATLGGAVASGLCGPLRAANGSIRDHLLGTTMMDGRGEVLQFGGRVIKNVAGYDASRMMAGSLGVLGLLLDLTLRVVPLPAAQATLYLELDHGAAIRRMNELAAQPLPLVASAWLDGALFLRLGGALAAVKEACRRIGGDVMEPAHASTWWSDLRDHRLPFFQADGGGTSLWRVSVPSTATPLGVEGHQLLEWTGAQRWLCTDADPQAIKSAAAAAGGHAIAFRGGPLDRANCFGPVPPAAMRIQQRLKLAFDPHGVFNRGRMHSEF